MEAIVSISKFTVDFIFYPGRCTWLFILGISCVERGSMPQYCRSGLRTSWRLQLGLSSPSAILPFNGSEIF